MTEGQYRAIIAYMSYWPKRHPKFDFDHAIKDIGITDDKITVIHELWRAGWNYNETKETLTYSG